MRLAKSITEISLLCNLYRKNIFTLPNPFSTIDINFSIKGLHIICLKLSIKKAIIKIPKKNARQLIKYVGIPALYALLMFI